MNFFEAVSSGFRNYFNFNGRACRAEFWYFILFSVLASFVAMIIDALVFGIPLNEGDGIVNVAVGVGLVIPNISVTARRLHDVGQSGWWQLAVLTIIGGIYPLTTWYCKAGDKGDNKFGPDPLG